MEMPKLTPSQLFSVARAFIRACRHLMVSSAPGLGKTAILKSAIAAEGADLILSHPAVEDPTDAKGLPFIVEGKAIFLPFGPLRRAIEATRPTVWVLDDFGQAMPSMQAAYMQLLHGGEVNGQKIAPCVSFMVATNRRQDRSAAGAIIEAVKSRIHTSVELTPNLDDSCSHAFDSGWVPEIPAYWRFKPEHLSDFQPTADLTQSPSPRTWEHVNDLLGMGLDAHSLNVCVAGAIGPSYAAEFLAFLKMFRELPNVDAILMDHTHGDVPTAPATLYALAGALAYRATPANFARVAGYAERMMQAGRAEFAVLMVRDACRRSRDLCSTAAFVKLSTSELGQLVNGR